MEVSTRASFFRPCFSALPLANAAIENETAMTAATPNITTFFMVFEFLGVEHYEKYLTILPYISCRCYMKKYLMTIHVYM